jgi:proline iminopeptidase
MRLLVLLLSVLPACIRTESEIIPTPSAGAGYFAGADSARLYYRTVGAGSDTVVVVHGQQGNTLEYLAPDLEPLAEGRVLLFYTQRGGGRSDPVEDPAQLGIGAHVRDLESLRQHFDLERLTLLAHSGGAGIAARYALEHPTRVERMLLISPMPPAREPFGAAAGQRFGVRFDSVAFSRLQALHASLATVEDPTAVCQEIARTVLPLGFLATAEAAERMRGDFCSAPPERLRTETRRLAAFQQSLGAWDWRPELRTLPVPTLVIHGAEDAIPEASARAWVEALPNARLLVLPEADHYPHVDQPPSFFAAARQFLRGGWPTGSPTVR